MSRYELGKVYPGAYRELPEDLPEVVVDRVRRDVQAVGDLLVGQRLTDQRGDRDLLAGQLGPSGMLHHDLPCLTAALPRLSAGELARMLNGIGKWSDTSMSEPPVRFRLLGPVRV